MTNDTASTEPVCETALYRISPRHRTSCSSHSCVQVDGYPTGAASWRFWECDLGRGWRFIVEHGKGEPPRMTDLSGVKAALVGAIEHNHYSGDAAAPAVYRYLGAGRAELLACAHVEGTGAWVRDDTDENAPAQSYPRYQVTSPDGTRYLTFTVALTEC